MNPIATKYIPSLILLMTGMFIVFVFMSDATGDPGDGVMHFLFAKYAWKHHALFLDHWGKPLYIILSSPFAQFGYKGSIVFNILCTSLSAFLTWKIALRLKMQFAWLSPVLVFFTPIALPNYMSALTEPLFALVLISSVHFLFAGRAGISAILVSFLPFARTEGFFLIPIFMIVYLMRKDITSVLLTATGTLLFSIAGWLAKGDLLWIIHENPYTGAETLYGHGGFFDFITANEFIWGWMLSVLIVLGIVFYIRNSFSYKTENKEEAILLPSLFLVFLFMHSLFWWKGLFGSLGLHRVMASTIPVAILISLRGLQFIRNLAGIRTASIAAMITLALQIFLTVRQHPLPIRVYPTEQILVQSVQATKKNILPETKIMSGYPLVAMLVDRDPFGDHYRIGCDTTSSQFRNGDLFYWDSHFGMDDPGNDLEALRKNSSFEQIGTFGEIPATKDERKKKFAVVVFRFVGEEK